MYELLRAEAEKQKRLQKLRNADLAKLTGFKKSTIDKFMSGHQGSDTIADAIAHVLNIRR